MVGLRRTVAASLFALPTLWAPALFADALSDSAGKLYELEGRIKALDSGYRDEAAPPVKEMAERRLIDAETLIELKSYSEAATLLLDIVEKYPDTRVYDDAVVLLGEAMYQERDILAARRYFKLAAEKKGTSRRQQQALQRLIEIALRTDDFDGVDEYLERMAAVPAGQLEPSVPYVRGKYQFMRGRFDDALAAFNLIAPTNPYYLKARYFIGTTFVQNGDLASAGAAFQLVLNTQAANDGDREIQDLARMAMGRIHYERSQFAEAKGLYVSIDRRSPHFGDALFETAWTSIKASDFKSAHRAIDLMLLENPDTPRAPEMKLLMGNLSLRMQSFFEASEIFNQSREQFEPIYGELKSRLDQVRADPNYVTTLLGASLEKFDVSIFVPTAASKFVANDSEIDRVVAIAGEVGEIRSGIAEAESLLARLDRAVNGGGKVAIFADLAEKREASAEVLNQALDIRKKLAESARSLAEPHLSAEDKAALSAHTAERQRLETELKDLPMTAEALRERDKGAKGELQGLEGQVSEINVLIQSLEAELVAIEQYDRSQRVAGQTTTITADELAGQAQQLHELIEELRKQNDELRLQLADSARQNTVAGQAGEGERSAMKRLSALITEEYEILRKARAMMSGDNGRQFDGIAGVLQKADEVQNQVSSFDARIDASAEGRLVKIRETVEAERTNLKIAAEQLSALTTESKGVGGGLAQTLLARVTDRFYDLVVQSDVGIIDVAWGMKDEKTQNLNKLVTQQKNEMQTLDEDFRQILEGEDQ